MTWSWGRRGRIVVASALCAGFCGPGVCGEGPANPVKKCVTQRLDYTNGETSLVRIDIDTEWVNGCALSIAVDRGTTVTVAVKNVNHALFPVAFDDKAEEPADAGKVPDVLAQLLGLPGAKSEKADDATKVAMNAVAESPVQSKSVLARVRPGSSALPAITLNIHQLQTFAADPQESPELLLQVEALIEKLKDDPDALVAGFEEEIQRLKEIGALFNSIETSKKRAVKYADLLGVLQETCPKLMRLATRASTTPNYSEVGCIQALELLGTKEEAETKPALAKNLGQLESLARLSPDKSLLGYAVQTAQAKHEVAVQFLGSLGKLSATVKGYFDKGATEAALFTSVKSYEIDGKDRRVSVTIKASSDKDAAVTHKYSIKISEGREEQFAFSTGFFFSSLTDRSYVARTSGDSRVVSRQGDEDDLRSAVGVMAHWRCKKEVALSVGVTGRDSELQYLIGVSGIWGSRQNFVLSAGAAVGSVKRLDGVKVGDILDADTVPTKDVTQVGAFVGASFKF